MNPLIYVILAIIGVFTLFLYLGSVYKIYEPHEELYEHTGSCASSPISFCLDTKSFYFKKRAEKLDYRVVEQDYNQWLRSVNKGELKVEMRYNKESKSFVAYALQDLKRSDLLFSLSDKNIFHKISMSASNFNTHMNATKLENDQYVFNKMNLSSLPNILIMSLVYHIYHEEFSNFRPWLLSLTPEVDNFFAKMTAYEYNTFVKNNKEINHFVKDYFETLDKDWKSLDYFIKKRMSLDERQSFFNGHEFTKTDFIFARSVTERHAWSIANDKELILYPSFDNYPRRNIEQDKYYLDYFRQQEIHALSNTSAVFDFVADRNISKGDLVYMSFIEPRGFLSSLLFGVVPKKSYMDCIVTEIFFYEDIFSLNERTKFFLKWAAESGTLCLNENPYSIARLKIVGSIMNMNQEETESCFAILNKARDNEDRYRMFLGSCANPEWKKADPRKNPLKSLNLTLSYFQDHKIKIDAYLKNRRDYGKDTKNAGILAEYAEEKIRMIGNIMEKIKNVTPVRDFDMEYLNEEDVKDKKLQEARDEKVKGMKTEI